MCILRFLCLSNIHIKNFVLIPFTPKNNPPFNSRDNLSDISSLTIGIILNIFYEFCALQILTARVLYSTRSLPKTTHCLDAQEITYILFHSFPSESFLLYSTIFVHKNHTIILRSIESLSLRSSFVSLTCT